MIICTKKVNDHEDGHVTHEYGHVTHEYGHVSSVVEPLNRIENGCK